MKVFSVKNIFRKKETENMDILEEKLNIEKEKNSFIESLKNVENEEMKILKLQKQYDSGIIKDEDLTQEQINSLCKLYDKQIVTLKKSNEIRKQKLLEYRKKMQASN